MGAGGQLGCTDSPRDSHRAQPTGGVGGQQLITTRTPELKTYKRFGSWLLLFIPQTWQAQDTSQGGLLEVVAGQWPALKAISWLPCCST